MAYVHRLGGGEKPPEAKVSSARSKPAKTNISISLPDDPRRLIAGASAVVLVVVLIICWSTGVFSPAPAAAPGNGVYHYRERSDDSSSGSPSVNTQPSTTSTAIAGVTPAQP